MIQIGIVSNLSFATDNLCVSIRNKGDDFLIYARGFSEDGYLIWDNILLDAAMMESKPTFIIQEDIARALMEKLITHFEGSSDNRIIRQDFLHERDRRDILEDALMAIATGTRP